MKRYIYILLAAMLFASCDSFLDVTPKDKFVPKNTVDYDRMLNDQELLKGHRLSFAYASDNALLTEEIFNSWGTSNDNKDAYRFQRWNASSKDEVCNKIYKNIFTYNVIIDEVMASNNGSETEKKQILGEALLGRAFEYFMAVNMYAKHYDAATAATEPGMPLVLVADINKKITKRNTIAEVYAQIEEDLNEAVSLLSDDVFNCFRGSKYAALGMLAKVSLYKSDYENALKYSTMVLDNYNFIEDYNNYDVLDNQTSFGRTNMPHSWESKENIYLKNMSMGTSVSDMVMPSEELQSLYTDSDKRWELFYSEESMRYELPAGKKIFYAYDYERNIAVSVPMLYLVRAEAYVRLAEQGNNYVTKSMEDINYLRKYRIKTDEYVELTAGTADEALKVVLDERRRETAFNCNRWFDLKRLNLNKKTEVTITRTLGDKTFVLKPGDEFYVIPIPAQIMDFHQDWAK